jgi:hypothetical protein
VANGHPQGAFADTVFERRVWVPQKERELVPALEHVLIGLAAAGVGLDVLLSSCSVIKACSWSMTG